MKIMHLLKAANIKLHQCTLILLLIVSFSHGVMAKTIRFYLDDVNPYAYEKDGELKGVLVEWVELIAEKSNLSFDISLVPTARILMAFELGYVDMSIQTKVDDLFQHALPIAEIPSYSAATFSLKENVIKSLDTLNGKTVCLLLGSSYGKDFDNNKQIVKYYVSTYRQIIQMVIRKRCFAGVGVTKGLEFRLKALGYHPEQFAQPFDVHLVPLYVIVSNKKADAKFIPLIKKVVNELKKQGAFKAIVANYEILDSER